MFSGNAKADKAKLARLMKGAPTEELKLKTWLSNCSSRLRKELLDYIEIERTEYESLVNTSVQSLMLCMDSFDSLFAAREFLFKISSEEYLTNNRKKLIEELTLFPVIEEDKLQIFNLSTVLNQRFPIHNQAMAMEKIIKSLTDDKMVIDNSMTPAAKK